MELKPSKIAIEMVLSQDRERFCKTFRWSIFHIITLLLGLIPRCKAYVPSFTTICHRGQTKPQEKKQSQQLQHRLLPIKSAVTDNFNTTISGPYEIRFDRKEKQTRRKMRPRRENDYWSNMDNIEAELRSFWNDLNVPQKTFPPTIPSEALLNHFQRHDLRYAIANTGGRESLAIKLGGAKLVPGNWRKAVKDCEEVLMLLDPENPAGVGLQRDLSPISTCVETGAFENGKMLKRWAHRSGRKPKKFWDRTVVIQELYQYVALVKEKKGRPSVWMPRLSELRTGGRNDLKQAIIRYGGAQNICTLGRLIPYHEWRYFESQLELYTRLQTYVTSDHHSQSTRFFPRLVDIKHHDERLHYLILEFGGRTMLAAKLDMDTSNNSSRTQRSCYRGMQFGAFDLNFAVRLLCLIRNDMYDIDPPANRPRITMLTQRNLVERGEVQLAKEVRKYGGHENVARRLGLEVCFDR